MNLTGNRFVRKVKYKLKANLSQEGDLKDILAINNGEGTGPLGLLIQYKSYSMTPCLRIYVLENARNSGKKMDRL